MSGSHGVRPPSRTSTLRVAATPLLDCGQPPRHRLIVRKEGASPASRTTNRENTKRNWLMSRSSQMS